MPGVSLLIASVLPAFALRRIVFGSFLLARLGIGGVRLWLFTALFASLAQLLLGRQSAAIRAALDRGGLDGSLPSAPGASGGRAKRRSLRRAFDRNAAVSGVAVSRGSACCCGAARILRPNRSS